MPSHPAPTACTAALPPHAPLPAYYVDEDDHQRFVRRIFDVEHTVLHARVDALGMSLGECLLTPTKIYVKPILALLDKVAVRGISHITGGGFYENIPRMLPEGNSAVLERGAVRVLPVFELLQKTGRIPERDMFNTFNMGVGMVCAVPADQADESLRILRAQGEDAYLLGEIRDGEKGVELC